MSVAEPMIRLSGVTKVFPGSSDPAVDRLDLDVGRGEFVALVGPSGCGKTTTLRMINRIIEPTSGRIEIDGVDVLSLQAHVLRRSIGYVIQQIGLFPHRSLSENISIVPALLGWDRGRIRDRVLELTEMVGLDPGLLERYPAELSGGQQQRVGVARALAADPPVLLMDEPFGAVDPIVRHKLQEEFRRLQERLGKTIVFVTHDIDEALYLGDRIAILNTGGRIEQIGLPEEILARPEGPFVEEFLGGERGLKRLALMPIGANRLVRGPMVDRNDSAGTALEVMRAHAVDWFGVLDGDRLLGWAHASDLGTSNPADLHLRPLISTIASSASLREALDAVVTGHTRLAVVVDDGVFKGVLDVESIAREITE